METPKVHPEQLSMKTTKKLMPGQPGTKKLFEQYGSDLVCVRYRYDFEQRLDGFAKSNRLAQALKLKAEPDFVNLLAIER